MKIIPFHLHLTNTQMLILFIHEKKKIEYIDLKIAETIEQFYRIREVNKKLLSRSKRTNYKARGRLYLLLRKVGYLTTQ